MTHQALKFVPYSQYNYISRIVCYVMTAVFHERFMHWAEKNQESIDLLGVQYYARPLIGGWIPGSICQEDETMVESMQFRFDPKGILPVLTEVSQRLPNVPLIVTETGTAGSADKKTYFENSLLAVRDAQDTGINVIGYMPWTLYGNFEWAHGFSREHDFGVIERNPSTGERTQRDAYQVISDVFHRTANQRAQFVA